ncbi:MAG: c-type cytochrome [Pseudomonadota bacterium]|nr:c-type cytochrome [Pseudomonadota bacterium]
MKIPFVLGGAVLLACAAKAPQPTAEQLALGERAYQQCYSCHALEPGKNDLQGPTLHGIVGRPVAAEPGFDYSPALRRFATNEPRWTRELIERFAADPERLVPGTSMSFHGLDSDDERKALVEYLEHQTSARAASLP